MSKKTFKASLKSEFNQKIPNVLNKINLETIHIKEKETTRFKRPVLRLVTSLSFAIVLLLVVGFFALRGPSDKPKERLESKQMMTSVVQAYQLANNTATVNIPKVTLSNDEEEPNGDYLTDINNIFNDIFKEIDVYFESVETLLFAGDFTALKKVNNISELHFQSTYLSGVEMEYVTKYVTTENEDGTITIEGTLHLGDRQVASFTSTLDNKDVVTTKMDNGIIIKSWTTKDEDLGVDVTVFEIQKKVYNGTQVSTIRKYTNKDGKDVIELKPECFRSRRTFTFITGKDKSGSDVVEVVIDEKFQFISLGNQFRIIISSIETDLHIEYTYDFKGTVTIAIAGISIDYEFQTNSKHEKRQTGAGEQLALFLLILKT